MSSKLPGNVEKNQSELRINIGCGPATGDQKRRSRSVSGGAMTKYRVDQGFGVVNEENSGGTLLSTYIHHPGRQIGTVLATSEGSTASSGTWNYYFQDAIGSTRSLWDEDGDRLGKYDYTPFGGKYGNTGEEITRKFTGHDWDNEARLYHTAYRQYSPDTGRWLTRDPLGMVDGPNVYAYVVNNPVSMFDALGKCAGPKGSSASMFGEGVWHGALIFITLLLALEAVAALIASMANKKWGGRRTSVGVALLACAGCIAAAGAIIFSRYRSNASSYEMATLLISLGALCGATCVGFAAVFGFFGTEASIVANFARAGVTEIGVTPMSWAAAETVGLVKGGAYVGSALMPLMYEILTFIGRF